MAPKRAAAAAAAAAASGSSIRVIRRGAERGHRPHFSHPCPRRRCATLTLSLLPPRSPRRRTTAARPGRHGSRHRHRASPAPRTLPQNPTTRLPALMPPLPAEMTPTLTTAGFCLMLYDVFTYLGCAFSFVSEEFWGLKMKKLSQA